MSYLVANCLSVEEDFLFKELKETWGKELKVLDIGLLGWTGSLNGGVGAK